MSAEQQPARETKDDKDNAVSSTARGSAPASPVAGFNLEVTVGSAPRDVVDMLTAIEWGTSGFTWTCPDTPGLVELSCKKFAPLRSYAARRAGGELLGALLINTELAPALEPGVQFQYLWCFGVKAAARGARVGATLQRDSIAALRAEPRAAGSLPRLLWLTVESDNVRSLRRFGALEDIGVKRVAELIPLVGCFALASRSPLCGRLSGETEANGVLERIRASRAAAGIVDLCPRPDLETYRVIRDESGRVVAGADVTSRVRAQPCKFRNWYDSAVQVVSGWLGSALPMYQSDGCTAVVSLSNVLCEPGSEAQFWRLVESVQCEFGASCCIAAVDSRDEMLKRLSDKAKAGASGIYGSIAAGTFPNVEIYVCPIDKETEQFVSRMSSAPVSVPYHAW